MALPHAKACPLGHIRANRNQIRKQCRNVKYFCTCRAIAMCNVAAIRVRVLSGVPVSSMRQRAPVLLFFQFFESSKVDDGKVFELTALRPVVCAALAPENGCLEGWTRPPWLLITHAEPNRVCPFPCARVERDCGTRPPPACVFYSCSIGLIEVSDLLLLARERSRSEFLEVLDNNDDDYQK
jgi:hypothetical protein